MYESIMKLRHLIWIKYEFIISHVWIHLESITIALWIHAWLNLESIVIPLRIPYDPITHPERKSIMNPLWTYEFSMNSVWIHYESSMNPLYDSLPNPLWTNLNPEYSIMNPLWTIWIHVWTLCESIMNPFMTPVWIHHGFIMGWSGLNLGSYSRWTNSSS